MREDFSKQYDVAVAGGGIAGVAAALAAARMGKKVALLEKTVLWGGLATTGMIFIYLPLCDGNGTQVTFGISEELLKAGFRYGPGAIPEGWRLRKSASEEQRYRTVFSPASMILALDEVLEAAGIDLWLDTVVIDAPARDDRLESLLVANKSGIGRIRAERYVDATGDADLAFLAGADCPTAENALAFWCLERQPGMDSHRGLAPDIHMRIQGLCNDPAFSRPGINGEMVSEFVLAGRKLYREELQAAYATGGATPQSRFPLKVPAMAQFRHTRRIDGLFTLLPGMEWRSFDDSIGMVADWRCSGKVWEIPYRTLLSAELENVAAAGRCISSDGDAWEVTRVIQAAALTGEAAGTAAALSLSRNKALPELDVPALQQQLRENGNRIHLGEVYPDRA